MGPVVTLGRTERSSRAVMEILPTPALPGQVQAVGKAGSGHGHHLPSQPAVARAPAAMLSSRGFDHSHAVGPVPGTCRRPGQYGARVDACVPDRPGPAKPCSTCGELTGRGYPSCLGCAEVVDQRWLTDWQELLATERASAGSESERALA